ncbi:MAG: class I SAM-dependent methyltransferase, partial [Cyclobacteriaceae bacterium]|nr:class I SAM-dependent methyltransferase [Cyclobacteriaceae bacterium]
KEHRVYPDETVAMLPQLHADHPLAHEWKLRTASSELLINYLKKSPSKKRLLEIGCGNGWLSHRLAESLGIEVTGQDINEQELTQAARVFRSLHDRLTFIYTDIFGPAMPSNYFDCIVLAASIQYFQDLSALIERCKKLLTVSGEIHIIDSPLYSPSGIADARHRTEAYFTSLGYPEMKTLYYHHSKNDLMSFNPTFLFDPSRMIERVKKLLGLKQPAFPWVMIKK